jgi:hypothetical protein
MELFDNFIWESDYNGYEVGYDDIDVVGLYRLKNTSLYIYINYENNNILKYMERD